MAPVVSGVASEAVWAAAGAVVVAAQVVEAVAAVAVVPPVAGKEGSMQKRFWKQVTGVAKLEAYWLRRTHFHDEALNRITAHIRQSEARHTGELMVAIETITPEHEPDSRLRALEVFGRLRTWDTPLNTGVLLYLSLDKARIEIIADRGIDAPAQEWEGVCALLQQRLAAGDYIPGLLQAIDRIEAILRRGCPPASQSDSDSNILPDEPVML